MENVELNNLDAIVRIVDRVNNFLNHVTSDSELDFMKLKSQLDREYKVSTVKNLEIELRNTFLKMNDSTLQNNFGFYLFQLVEGKLKPFYYRIMDDYQHEYNQDHKSEYPEFIDYNFHHTLDKQSEMWIWIIFKYIEIFAPAVYSEKFSIIDNVLPKYDEEGYVIFDYVSEIKDSSQKQDNTPGAFQIVAWYF